MVALRTSAQALAHPRSPGVGFFMMRLASRLTHLSGPWLALLAACNPAHDRPSGPLSFTDDAGRALALAQPARRVVSLSPATTELLFALGAGERVVGRTTWCKYPPEAERVPSVGDGISPNVEAVAAREPDLVLLYRSALNATAADQFARLGIVAAVLAQDRLADVARDARLLGKLVGREAAGDSIAHELEALIAGTPAPTATTLAFVVWDNPPTVIGAGSFLNELARLAGAHNVFADIAAPSANVSLETLASRNPDVIAMIVDDPDAAGDPDYAARREWRAVPAVRARRFVRLPADLFGRPSPRAGEAVAELRRLLAEATR